MKRLLLLFAVSLFLSTPLSAQTVEWNQWRGPRHDGKSLFHGIATEWPADGPKLLWKIDSLGEGYSNFSFWGDKMFTMGDKNGECYVIALDRKTGKTLWETSFADAAAPGGYGGPKCTPATDGKTVFALGQLGDFIALDIETGKEIWGGQVIDDLGGKVHSGWGYATSPILDGDKLILTVGGEKGILVAFDKTSGKRLWQSKELAVSASYASAVPVDIEGVHQYLVFSEFGTAGINAEDGSLLWKAERPGRVALCSDPVYENGVLVMSSAYRVGTNAFSVGKAGDKFETKELYGSAELENHHGGLAMVEGYVYMLTNREFVCLEPKTGKVVYKDRSVGKGSLCYVDGHFILRSEGRDGTIALVEANPEKYVEKARFNQPSRTEKNSWTYPLVIDGKMFLRDQGQLFCYDVVTP
jgi:outer membrane protein assembly factor BamB